MWEFYLLLLGGKRRVRISLYACCFKFLNFKVRNVLKWHILVWHILHIGVSPFIMGFSPESRLHIQPPTFKVSLPTGRLLQGSCLRVDLPLPIASCSCSFPSCCSGSPLFPPCLTTTLALGPSSLSGSVVQFAYILRDRKGSWRCPLSFVRPVMSQRVCPTQDLIFLESKGPSKFLEHVPDFT